MERVTFLSLNAFSTVQGFLMAAMQLDLLHQWLCIVILSTFRYFEKCSATATLEA